MFGDSIVICVFWGRRNERGSLRGIIYKKIYIKNCIFKREEILNESKKR